VLSDATDYADEVKKEKEEKEDAKKSALEVAGMESDDQSTKKSVKHHPVYQALMLAQTGSKNGSKQKLNLKTKNKLKLKAKAQAKASSTLLAGLDAEQLSFID
jgi:hypothetical protein